MARHLIKSLLKPQAYPEPTSKVSCKQTHVSIIFLTDNYAYKIKKPVDFGFLNFSTIDRRRFYCNEEVRLNRRLCPDIYEGVVEIRQTEHGPSFHGEGQILEYAVKMKRLPAEKMLDRLIINDLANEETIRSVVRVIADFHHTIPTSSSVAEYGTPDRIRYNWQENFDQITAYQHETLPSADRETIQHFIFNYMTDHQTQFEDRVKNGFIRECDGDIHLENICVENDKIYIFDCIEFNDRFRCCDTAADIAFLLMDLDYHEHHDLATVAIDEYINRSGDISAAQLIVFYQIYRAFVRGKVESFLLHDPAIEEEQRTKASLRAIRYFRLARGYMERLRLKTTLFITCGLMGCGKSSIASQLAFELGIPVFSSDRTRKELENISLDTAVIVPYSTGIYDQEHNVATYSELLRLAQQEIAKGQSVIVDASFTQYIQRSHFKKASISLGVRFVILELECKISELKRRLQNRSSKGGSVSDGRLELLQQQVDAFQHPQQDEGIIISLDTKFRVETIINSIYDRLAQC